MQNFALAIRSAIFHGHLIRIGIAVRASAECLSLDNLKGTAPGPHNANFAVHMHARTPALRHRDQAVVMMVVLIVMINICMDQ